MMSDFTCGFFLVARLEDAAVFPWYLSTPPPATNATIAAWKATGQWLPGVDETVTWHSWLGFTDLKPKHCDILWDYFCVRFVSWDMFGKQSDASSWGIWGFSRFPMVVSSLFECGLHTQRGRPLQLLVGDWLQISQFAQQFCGKCQCQERMKPWRREVTEGGHIKVIPQAISNYRMKWRVDPHLPPSLPRGMAILGLIVAVFTKVRYGNLA